VKGGLQKGLDWLLAGASLEFKLVIAWLLGLACASTPITQPFRQQRALGELLKRAGARTSVRSTPLAGEMLLRPDAGVVGLALDTRPCTQRAAGLSPRSGARSEVGDGRPSKSITLIMGRARLRDTHPTGAWFKLWLVIARSLRPSRSKPKAAAEPTPRSPEGFTPTEAVVGVQTLVCHRMFLSISTRLRKTSGCAVQGMIGWKPRHQREAISRGARRCACRRRRRR
jgi:hypothetical protein